MRDIYKKSKTVSEALDTRLTCRAFKSTEIKDVKSQFKISHHLQYGCTYTKNKPLRIYGYFCDMMIFKDGVLVF